MATWLARRGLLLGFYTGLVVPNWMITLPGLPQRFRAELARRGFQVCGHARSLRPLREAVMIALERLPMTAVLRPIAVRYRNESMAPGHDRAFARIAHACNDGHIVYCYLDSASASIAAAREAGAFTVVEVTSPYHAVDRTIFETARRDTPECADLLPPPRDDDRVEAEQAAVLAAADVIVVPSRFVHDSLPHAVRGKAAIMPYALADYAELAAEPLLQRIDGTLRILFVGGLTQRKGVCDLARAVARFGNGISLTMVGRGPFADLEAVRARFGADRWFPSLPNVSVRQLMREADVLVLPSLSDAFGLVVLEALSLGTPVIVTRAVGAADLVEDGVSGFVLEPGDVDALVDRLKRLANDCDLRENMSAAARASMARHHAADPVAPTIAHIIDAATHRAKQA